MAKDSIDYSSFIYGLLPDFGYHSEANIMNVITGEEISELTPKQYKRFMKMKKFYKKHIKIWSDITNPIFFKIINATTDVNFKNFNKILDSGEPIKDYKNFILKKAKVSEHDLIEVKKNYKKIVEADPEKTFNDSNSDSESDEEKPKKILNAKEPSVKNEKFYEFIIHYITDVKKYRETIRVGSSEGNKESLENLYKIYLAMEEIEEDLDDQEEMAENEDDDFNREDDSYNYSYKDFIKKGNEILEKRIKDKKSFNDEVIKKQ
jgi:hypothetical protein